MIERNIYLQQLISKKENGLIKVITGIRRCGKSFLLFEIYYDYLINSGVDSQNIIKIPLDTVKYAKLRNPSELLKFIDNKINNNKKYYLFIDEIQFVKPEKMMIDNSEIIITFYDLLNELLRNKNLDIYVTGSNSKMLSSDILTEFRGRGDEIRVYPLSFSEVYKTLNLSKEETWKQYINYGGLPLVLSQHTHQEKSKYLNDLFKFTYLADVIEHNHVTKNIDDITELMFFIASSIGSLTNKSKLSKAFKSIKNKVFDDETIGEYIKYFENAFLISRSVRYDVKGKKYISTPCKYYFTDIGIRNSILNFRQIEETHIMENIIYNELLIRGYNVDTGMVEIFEHDENGKTIKKDTEIDFIVNIGSKKYYIQSALRLDDEEKRKSEIKSLINTKDFFKKIVIIKDDIISYHDDNGIVYIGLYDFLLDSSSIIIC